MKGISVKNKHSYNDFFLSIAERKISPPSLKRITETVPYMNGEYDFSCLDGEIALENRELYYSFEIAEISTEQMEETKQNFLSWLYSVVDSDIFDDYLPNYYFHGSLKNVEWTEDFGKGILNVTFSVYPYKFEKKETTINLSVNQKIETTINVNSTHPIIPSIFTSNEINLEVNDNTFSLSNGKYSYEELKLSPGENKIIIEGTSEVVFTYRNEMI